MSHGFNTSARNEAEKNSIEPFIGVRIRTSPTTDLNYWLGQSDQTIDGRDWIGNVLLNVGSMKERDDLTVNKVKIELSGTSDALVTAMQNKGLRNNPVEIYVGIMDNYRPVGNFVLFWGGVFESAVINHSTPRTINISVASLFADFDRAEPKYYTGAEQDILFPGTPRDEAFDFVDSFQNRDIEWGSGTASNGQQLRPTLTPAQNAFLDTHYAT